MPHFDGTGPHGIGPGTGKGFGPCFGFGPGHTPHHPRGLHGYFNWNWPTDKEGQKKVLADYLKALEEEAEDVKKELEELE
jgi:hypothetical protein